MADIGRRHQAKDGKQWKNRMNADDVKVALIHALATRGVKARAELRIRGIYGPFPADVGVLTEDRQLVTVAEAKVKRQQLRIKQRTNYATCGVPAFLCDQGSIEQIADLMAAYVLKAEMPPSKFLITERTYASDHRRQDRIAQHGFERRLLRG